jgi:hypothetical protein
MGIQVEYNPDLALRNIEEFIRGNRKKEECIPKNLELERIYEFLKKGQRNYWLEGEIPLVETKGNGQLSRPLASIVILEETHYLINNQSWTRGRYKVVEAFNSGDNRIHFEGFNKVNYEIILCPE